MRLKKSIQKFLNLLFFIIILFYVFEATAVFGLTKEEELRNQIRETTLEMERIQKEIDQYSKLYNDTTKQSKSLENTLKQLEINRKKLEAELSYTEKQIKSSTLTLKELGTKIGETQLLIDNNSKALAQSLILLDQAESNSSVEEFMKYKTISEAWDYVLGINRFQSEVKNKIILAKDLREDLQSKKDEMEEEKNRLVNYQAKLSDQKVSIEYSKKEKDELLSETKNRESEYKKILAERQKQRDAFEQELFAYESELRLVIDPSSIPEERRGVLSWPLDNIFITQYFGKTSASKRLYVSGTHNGVDFRASIGTPVKVALSGIVWATGNTDLESGCYSYGKWVLIKHANGLSSLYGHLSQIKVSAGDTIITGEVLGYSGNTGYSTGPHLHFGVFATQGIVVDQYSKSKYCKNTVMPLADIKAYLDPMVYLPKP